jgi:hypothetical protein
MSELAPALWSDFDGTAVEKLNPKNPRHWPRNIAKYPLAGIEGYADFLKGAQASGVEIGGVVSRRPNIFVRRLATVHSIRKLGLVDYFPRGEHLALEGSEEAKAKFVARQSRQRVIGVLEDNPQKLGVEIMKVLGDNDDVPAVPPHSILLGVVHHPKSQKCMGELADKAGPAATDLASQLQPADGFTIRTGSLNMHVVKLQPYSQIAGEDFGQQLVKLAA